MKKIIRIIALLLVMIFAFQPIFAEAVEYCPESQEMILINNLEPIMGRGEDGQVEELMIKKYLMDLSYSLSGDMPVKTMVDSNMEQIDCRYFFHPEKQSLTIMGINQLITMPFREKYMFNEKGMNIGTIRSGYQKRGYCLYETANTRYGYAYDDQGMLSSIEYYNDYTGWENEGAPKEEETIKIDINYGQDVDMILNYTITDMYATSYETVEIYKDELDRVETIKIDRDRNGDMADMYYDAGLIMFEYKDNNLMPSRILTENTGHFSGDWKEEYQIIYDDKQRITDLREVVTKAFGMDNPGMEYNTKFIYDTLELHLFENWHNN